MLMPRPVASHYRTTAAPQTYQLKVNSAAIAPKWNIPMTTLTGQFTFWPLDILTKIVFTRFSTQTYDAINDPRLHRVLVRLM